MKYDGIFVINGPYAAISDLFFHPKKVIFNNGATIVLWDDGSKTVVQCQKGDVYDSEVGYAMCWLKKLLGNTGTFNKIFRNKAYLEGVEKFDKEIKEAPVVWIGDEKGDDLK